MLYMHKFTHTCICVYIHACISTNGCIYGNGCMHMHACIYTNVYINACMHAYMYIVVNFNAVAQASNIWIGRRQVVFLCWMRDSVFGTESPADWMAADKPTEPSKIKLKTWTQQPVPMISEHSSHSTPLPVGFRTWLWQYTCFFLFISMLWHSQAIIESKAGELSSSVQCCSMIRTIVFGTEFRTDWMAADKPTELSRIKLKSTTFLNEFDSINVLVFLLQFQWNLLPRAQYKIRNRSYT